VNILELLGHGVKVAAKDTGKGIATAAKDIGKAAATAAPVALEVAGEVVTESFPASNIVSRGMASVFHTSIHGDTMNPLESFAITMVFGTLQIVVKNPAHKAALEHQLIGLADSIYSAYGIPVPMPTAPASDTAVHE
jgi:hypothetical protein